MEVWMFIVEFGLLIWWMFDWTIGGLNVVEFGKNGGIGW